MFVNSQFVGLSYPAGYCRGFIAGLRLCRLSPSCEACMTIEDSMQKGNVQVSSVNRSQHLFLKSLVSSSIGNYTLGRNKGQHH